MSQIVTTTVGRFRRVKGDEPNNLLDAWLWECPCGQWAYLSDDQWHGRVSVDHASEGCQKAYHETHDYATELFCELGRWRSGVGPNGRVKDFNVSSARGTRMTDALRELETLEAKIRKHARANGWFTWLEDLTGWANRLAEIRALLAAGGSVASQWQPIDTAPAETIVLVHDEGYIGKAMKRADGRWLDLECGRDDPPGTDTMLFNPPPTAWMPLPDPPTKAPE